MPVTLQIATEEVVAYLSGEIDHHLAKDLRESIDTACQSHLPTRLVLDFSGVTFMDSSGIGLIMGRYRLMEELGGKLLVVNIPRSLRRVMQVAGLEKLGVLEGGATEPRPSCSRK